MQDSRATIVFRQVQIALFCQLKGNEIEPEEKSVLRKLSTAFLLTIAWPTVAQAEVTDAAPAGFTTVNEIIISAARDVTWNAAVNEIGEWWNSSHTVAGDAARMSIDPRPMGCFCELLSANDGVVHLTVTSVSRNTMLRMTGGLGPLGLMGVNGNMTWEFFDSDIGTRVKFTYAVGGYLQGGLDKIAGPVDAVIGEALRLLKAHVEAGATD
jgi:hypothetical protein